jgi:hypothetical protein
MSPAHLAITALVICTLPRAVARDEQRRSAKGAGEGGAGEHADKRSGHHETQAEG